MVRREETNAYGWVGCDHEAPACRFGVWLGMRHSLRLTIAAASLAALAACSRSSEQPSLSDDLKQDLAKAGGSDVVLASSSTARLDVVSAAERTNGATAAPKSPTVSKAPSAIRGRTAAVKSPRRVTPAAAQPSPRAAEAAPAEVRTEEPAPEPVQSQARPRAPLPSTQREPPGGWRSPGSVIRNAPFPINP
jgi:hypothetical protein